MNKLIRIGTRASKLALWQAEYVASLIRPSGYTVEIVALETKGDKLLEKAIPEIGSKGVFTEELETLLMEGSIDIAVHSAKDLPSEIPDELEILAFTERELVNDVFIPREPGMKLTDAGIRIGTSSTRRMAFIRHLLPKAEIVPVRGNLLTRFEKLKSGECDALILAFAGVHRLGLQDKISEMLETSYFVPAVGQGSLAIECHRKLAFEKKEVLSRWINHPATEFCIRTERSFLKTLQGGCSIPAFGYAHEENGVISLKAGIISLDGNKLIKIKDKAPTEDWRELGALVGKEVLRHGGAEILQGIKSGQPTK